MIDLPVGKALVAIYSEPKCKQECNDDQDYQCPNETCECCKGCDLEHIDISGVPNDEVCGELCCFSFQRKDGKNVIFKVVDHP